ncbi:hypothetical protein BC829DRAFT_205171 [Chytridium lagenaria]|nr:hypothetical protein BC829DRAFT_205171 [Chytridium lagenaria]
MLPERVVFCIDTGHDASTPCSPTLTKLMAVKELIKKFATQKSWMTRNHKFAIATFSSTVLWHSDFESDVVTFASRVNEVSGTNERVGYWDVSTLFDAIMEHMPPENPEQAEFCLRVIIIYFRSSVLPTLPSPAKMNEFFRNPNFTLESVFLHDKPSHENKVQEVYDRLNELDDGKGRSFETTLFRKLIKIFTYLLAHPKVRRVDDLTA